MLQEWDTLTDPQHPHLYPVFEGAASVDARVTPGGGAREQKPLWERRLEWWFWRRVH